MGRGPYLASDIGSISRAEGWQGHRRCGPAPGRTAAGTWAQQGLPEMQDDVGMGGTSSISSLSPSRAPRASGSLPQQKIFTSFPERPGVDKAFCSRSAFGKYQKHVTRPFKRHVFCLNGFPGDACWQAARGPHPKVHIPPAPCGHSHPWGWRVGFGTHLLERSLVLRAM